MSDNQNFFLTTQKTLRDNPLRWLVTGAAGFIGSNLVEHLLCLNQIVVGMDNLSTGFMKNLDEALENVSPLQASRFSFMQADIRDLDECRKACHGVDIVLHQAALGSVPRSIKDPITTHSNNVDGFINMLVAARDEDVSRFVYAVSSSIYGDNADLPKLEDRIGRQLSPYAVSKYVNELYAHVFGLTYGLQCIGLRYFNVFGRRQNPEGAYAAVIPKWFSAILNGENVYIFGDGETSRDFCYIDNVVQANVLAGVVQNPNAVGTVYNIAIGERTTLNQLFSAIKATLNPLVPNIVETVPIYNDFREGDMRHSLADISRARTLLSYEPHYSLKDGLREAARWYIGQLKI